MRLLRSSLAILIGGALSTGIPAGARGQVPPAAGPPLSERLATERPTRALLDTLAARLAALELRRIALQADSGRTAQHPRALVTERTIEALWEYVSQLPASDSGGAIVRASVIRVLEARLAHVTIEQITLVAGGELTAEHPRIQALRAHARLLAQRREAILPGAVRTGDRAPPASKP
jgi:hypothetical protein